MRRRLVATAACLVATLGTATACSSNSSGHGSTGSGIADAMDSVSGTGPAATYFEYGDTARMRALKIVNPAAASSGSGRLTDPRWNQVAGSGTANLASFSVILPSTIGLNIYAADAAVTIGQPPNTAVRLDGVSNTAAIRSKLIVLGAKPRRFGGTKGLSFGPDNSIDVNGSVATKIPGMINQLDQVVAGGTTFAASPNGASIRKVLGGTTSLLHTGHYQDIADCLGDVIAAVVLVPNKDKNAAVAAVGVHDPASVSAAGHEVLCVLPAGGRKSAVHDALASHLAPSSTDPMANAPLSTYVAKTKVTDTGKLVRAELTLVAKQPPGYLLRGIYQNQMSYWDGSCTAIQLARRSC